MTGEHRLPGALPGVEVEVAVKGMDRLLHIHRRGRPQAVEEQSLLGRRERIEILDAAGSHAVS